MAGETTKCAISISGSRVASAHLTLSFKCTTTSNTFGLIYSRELRFNCTVVYSFLDRLTVPHNNSPHLFQTVQAEAIAAIATRTLVSGAHLPEAQSLVLVVFVERIQVLRIIVYGDLTS